MPSFHYKVDFSIDIRWMIIVHKKCYGLLLHSKHVLIVDFFSFNMIVKIKFSNQIIYIIM